jgi:hypothetical protein
LVPKRIKEATARIVTYGLVAYETTAIYINKPQKIPSKIFSNHKLEILVSMIAAAGSEIGNPDTYRAKTPLAHPIKLPIYISKSSAGVILYYANSPALPVKR